mgnify:CR=1 FL=1|tara:strand:- start:316 stop:492 length:177 start_codon:yes stop_codon:yes gene_type:complete
MPEVGGKKFPYTPAGKQAAKKEMLKEQIKPGKMTKNRKTLKKSSNRDAVTKSNPMKMY